MAYPATTWAKVKADYETGDYSVSELGKKWGISETAIENRIFKDKWIKGKNIPAIEHGIAERNIAMFAKLGCTPQRVAGKLIEGIFAGEETKKQIAELIIKLREPSKDKKDKKQEEDHENFYETMTDFVKQLMGDKKTELAYAQEYNKMCGSWAPFKKELTGKEGNPLLPQNYTKEQIQGMIKDMITK